MKIGILVSSVSNFGNSKIYNSQEIGLAKALSKYCESVKVFKLVNKDLPYKKEKINKYSNIEITYIPSKSIGINGLIDLEKLDSDIDSLIYFSDTQLSTPKVYKWCKKNNIKFLPYVGIIKSNSNSIISRMIMKFITIYIFNIYKNNLVLAKTNYVKSQLIKKGIKKVIVVPVGLDIEKIDTLVNEDDLLELKKKYDIKSNEKIILMIGRLENDRSPLDGIELFNRLCISNKNYKLIIIGNGSLRDLMIDKIKKYNLEKQVIMIDKVDNSEMKKFYQLGNFLITFSRTEIFGMTILEAMYFGLPVYAYFAPGPNDIIENNISGFLSSNIDEMFKQINSTNTKEISKNAKNRIINNFTWSRTSKQIINIINSWR